ncbi:MAG: heme biosynthesis HemY N-terminal domain-containing protein [Xanthomonadales bacterium]|nr:heme biosynthesis HemY N-terminal domain-containing protein [Xanthomonadales bacterium]
MKALMAILLAALLAVATIWALPVLKGYVLVRAGGWAIEMNLLVLLTLLLGTYALIRFLVWAWFLPGNAVRSFIERRAAAQLEVGMLALSEGNWKKAEKALSQAARNSDNPAVGYLGAAQAAHRGGGEQRAEEYLASAGKDRKAQDSVVITRAQLQLAAGEPQLALDALDQVKRSNETRPRVLQLLARCYERLDRLQDLAALAPNLIKAGIIGPEQGDKIRRRGFLQSLSKAPDIGALEAAWRSLDRGQRMDLEFLQAFAGNAVQLGAGQAAEKDLLAAIRKQWSEPLMELYCELPGTGADLAQAEKWLKAHPDSAALHLLTARLCARSEIWGKAREHYETSVRLRPNPVVFAELADLKAQEGDSQGALNDYRRALGRDSIPLPKAPPRLDHG